MPAFLIAIAIAIAVASDWRETKARMQPHLLLSEQIVMQIFLSDRRLAFLWAGMLHALFSSFVACRGNG